MHIGFDFIITCCSICFFFVVVIFMYAFLQQLFIVGRFYCVVVVGFVSCYIEIVIFIDMI